MKEEDQRAKDKLDGAQVEIQAVFKKYDCIGYATMADGLGNVSGGRFTEGADWTKAMVKAAEDKDIANVLGEGFARYMQAMYGCGEFIQDFKEELDAFKLLLTKIGIEAKVK